MRSSGTATPSLRSKPFGTLPSGEAVTAWTLAGGNGLELEILDYGCLARRLLVPDRNGKRADIALGYDDLEPYLINPFYFGATVGPIAGRVLKGELEIEGTGYQLPLNDGRNHLHGGPNSLHSKLWKAEPIKRPDGSPSLRFRYLRPHLENGYPGNLELSLTFTVTAQNEFVLETSAATDQTTPVNLAHHSYFNLNGEGQANVLNHQIQIFSDKVAVMEEDMSHTDRFESVDGRPCDFRQPTRIGDSVSKLWQQHGDLYWLGEHRFPQTVAQVHEPESGRTLTVKTTQSCLQTYFATALDGSIQAKGNGVYEPFGAFCLECQGYPHAFRNRDFGDILVRPNAPQSHITVYQFGTRNLRNP